MPIEFRCSQCGQLLRVPETAAGKQARCPKCRMLMPVPVDVADIIATVTETSGGDGTKLSSPAVLSPPLVAAPQLSPANPFAGEVQSHVPQAEVFSETPGSLNPYASPASAGQGYAADYYYFGPRSGLPWENEPQTIGCFFRTMGLVLGSPTRAFSIMRQNGGMGGPMLFNFYSIGIVMALLLAIVVPFLIVLDFWQRNIGWIASEMAGFAVGCVFGVIIYAVVIPLICAAGIHVALLMVRGAKQGFETTFRVVCFGTYSLLLPGMVINLIPFGIGFLSVIIWTIVLLIYGISRAHETSGGRAAVSVLLPTVLCCGSFFGIAILNR
jgi:phage FluMu protein Com